VPHIAKSSAGRVKKDTKVFYNQDGAVLVSFWEKSSKAVLLIDTLHKTAPIPPVNQKCSTVLQYNRTKSGVDIFDKRVKGFSCKRKRRRGLYAIFSNVIDMATNNSGIIFNYNPKCYAEIFHSINNLSTNVTNRFVSIH
jgi:hypothetical protein